MVMFPLLLGVAASAFTLQIDVPDSRVLVGEPVKIVMRWRADSDRAASVVAENPSFGAQVVRFHVHDGTRERVYREWERGGGDVLVAADLAPGQEIASNLVLLCGAYTNESREPSPAEPLFGEPGTYRIRAEYFGPGSGAMDGAKRGVASNEVQIVVDAPTGADKEILALSLENRLVLDATGTAEYARRAALLMEANPDSPYFRWMRLRSLYFKGAEGAGRDNNQALLALRATNQDAYRREIAVFYAELAREVLSFDDWGAFEEDALAQGYAFARSAKDEVLMKEARDRLLASYPKSSYLGQLRLGGGTSPP